MSHTRDTIVIGASAGGIEALVELLSLLPADLPAWICTVVHISPTEPSRLDEVLDRAGPLPAKMAVEGEPLRYGQIYVAPPDRHLLLQDGVVWVRNGPKENRYRPAIDPLFRSAAVAYPNRTIGVVLSGVLNDGTAGLRAIKRVGGIAMVQDPEEASFAGMPLSALKNVDVDYCVKVKAMADIISRLVNEPADEPAHVPDQLRAEVAIAGRVMSSPQLEEKMGQLVPMTCPECRGPLWELTYDELPRYRCHVGHAFSRETLLADQGEYLEGLVWEAYRVLEEHIDLLNTTIADDEQLGEGSDAQLQRARMARADRRVKLLRQFIEGG